MTESPTTFALLILGAPYSTQSVNTALRFAKTAIDKGHKLYRVFFYHDAVNSGNQLITPPRDETNIPSEWQHLADEHRLDLVVCVASALKRGVLNSEEAQRYDKVSGNLQDGFDISGLGQLVDASLQADRVITFGP